MLSLARTLMGDPDLVLLDEPTEGLAPAVVAQIAALLRDLRRRGVAVLLAEQKLTLALQVCDGCLGAGARAASSSTARPPHCNANARFAAPGSRCRLPPLSPQRQGRRRGTGLESRRSFYSHSARGAAMSASYASARRRCRHHPEQSAGQRTRVRHAPRHRRRHRARAGRRAVRAIVIAGAGRAFSGGADIREFGSPKAIAEPTCCR